MKIWPSWQHRSYLRRSLDFPPTIASIRWYHAISVYGLGIHVVSVFTETPDIGRKSISRALLIYPDLSASERAARGFDICGNSDRLITDDNVVGFGFVIPKIYTIRETIKPAA